MTFLKTVIDKYNLDNEEVKKDYADFMAKEHGLTEPQKLMLLACDDMTVIEELVGAMTKKDVKVAEQAVELTEVEGSEVLSRGAQLAKEANERHNTDTIIKWGES